MSALGSGDGLMPTTTQTPDHSFSMSVRFDYTRPPLSANQRLHWRTKAKITKDVRAATKLLFARAPELGRCTVSLEWVVADRRRRDADNLVPTLKAMCDGLVDAGVVADDIPELMVKVMPMISYQPGMTAHMMLTVTGGA